jgi:copper(I)-binding protein
VIKRLAVLLLFSFLSFGASAAGLSITDAWIRLLPAGAPAGGYFTLHNDTKASAELLGASSQAFGKVMLHKTMEQHGRSMMMEAGKIEVPAGGKLEFAPGGYHMMMMMPRRKLAVGERVPVTLELSGGRKLTASFEVRGPAGK